MKYCEIVFLQNEDDFPPEWDEWGERKRINYLAKWDYGKEMEHTLHDNLYDIIGRDDHVFKQDEYILSYDDRMGTAGLTREVQDDVK